MKKALIFVLFSLVIGLTYTSLTPHNSFLLLVSVCLGLIFSSLLLAFLTSPWYFGTFKDRFKKGLYLGFYLSTSFYLLGYCFVLLESIIR